MAQNILFSGKIPEIYDEYLGPLLFEPYAKDLVERIRGKNFQSILELACGSGRLTQYLSRTFPEAKITATDLNEDMLAIAKKKVADKNVHWEKVDMQEIPFPDSSFDLVICQFGIMFVPDKIKALKEIYGVLKKDGMFLFNSWNKLEMNEFAETADKVINSFFPDEPIIFYQIPFSYFDEDQIKKDLKESGFKNIAVTHVQKKGQSPSPSHAATGLIEGNPALITMNERDPNLPSVIKEKMSKVISEKFGNGQIECSLNALVTESSK